MQARGSQFIQGTFKTLLNHSLKNNQMPQQQPSNHLELLIWSSNVVK